MAIPGKNRAEFATDGVLWVIIGLLGVFLLSIVLGEARRGWLPDGWGNVVVGSLLVSLSTAGIFWRWGPVIPCMFLGMIVLALTQSHTSSSPEEAVWKHLGVPILGAICGACAGWFVEATRWPNAPADRISHPRC